MNPKIALLYNSKKNKNSRIICNKIKYKIKNCNLFAVDEKLINLKKFDFIFIVVPNTGDEEIPQAMEDYLCSLKTKNKKYFLCELGNYFGLEYKGCKKIIFKILKKLNWKNKLTISLDSVPHIDDNELKKWIHKCKNKINQ